MEGGVGGGVGGRKEPLHGVLTIGNCQPIVFWTSLWTLTCHYGQSRTVNTLASVASVVVGRCCAEAEGCEQEGKDVVACGGFASRCYRHLYHALLGPSPDHLLQVRTPHTVVPIHSHTHSHIHRHTVTYTQSQSYTHSHRHTVTYIVTYTHNKHHPPLPTHPPTPPTHTHADTRYCTESRGPSSRRSRLHPSLPSR